MLVCMKPKGRAYAAPNVRQAERFKAALQEGLGLAAAVAAGAAAGEFGRGQRAHIVQQARAVERRRAATAAVAAGSGDSMRAFRCGDDGKAGAGCRKQRRNPQQAGFFHIGSRKWLL